MELFHTSPVEITAIRTTGRFGEFLFFSSRIYSMSAGKTIAYKIELDDSDLIEAGQLFHHAEAVKLDSLVAEFAARYAVDIDTAEEIISEREQLDSNDSDDLWDVQLFTARAAKILGYRGVAVADEQGTAYMIDMLDHEAELVLV